MTREEAIHFAECLRNNWTIDFNDMNAFCDMVIEAIKAQHQAPAHWEECDWVQVDPHGSGVIRTPKAGVYCTRCRHAFKKELLWSDNYCPNCGEAMHVR